MAAPLRAIVTATLAHLALSPGDITILLTDDAALRALNRRWRGIDRATDVLSFGYGVRGARVGGDLVISLDRMRVQARRYRTGAARELARLVIHGTLHLAGHDHHAAGERVRMRRIERAAMRGSVKFIAKLSILDRARPRYSEPAPRRKGNRR
ncbi:MAG: rRNA maturation RNase YbeY [Candidatus Eiseniibacteriota bacterium]